ncbi:MAG: hypothetical protein RLZ55_1394 [Actinomycetota bacterium]
MVDCASPGLADGTTPPPSFEGSAEATKSPQRSTPAAYVPQGRDVPAAGVVQHITCAGAKQDPTAPTVVLLAGLGAGAAQTWEGVFPSDAQDLSLRTCMVDRPGVGLSPDRPEGSNSPPINAQELLAGLAAAGERGPFIFAGWSYGGLVALLAAGAAHAADPSSVAGLVLIDPTLPDEYRTLDPEGWEEGDQELDMAAGEAAAATVRLGDAPVVVLVAGDNENNRDNWDLVLAGVRDVAGRSADFVVVDSPESSHDIAADDPAVILAALRTVVQAAGGSMPDCPPEFGASDQDWGCLAADGTPAGQQRSD